ncbi:GNAT family N-acetyltransferase [Deltaproteobacteria bacterium Smac51]|nr:GNAT family N-acetyltransferase [Deltaproteobacteria bacterium Smac51]
MIRITTAGNREDYELCADIWLETSLKAHDFVSSQFWEEQRKFMIEKYLPESVVFMATLENGPAVAFAALSGSQLAALFVSPLYWGQGVGGKLLRHVFTLYDDLSLKVYEKNKRAIAFYENMGFVETGRSLCGHSGEEELVMQLKSPR